MAFLFFGLERERKAADAMSAAEQMEKSCEETRDLLTAYNNMKDVILMDTIRITESLLDATGMSDLERTLWNTEYPKENVDLIPGENAKQEAEEASGSKKQLEELIETFHREMEQNRGIRLVVMRYYQMLTRLDMEMVLLNEDMQSIIEKRGISFAKYNSEHINLFRKASTFSEKIRAIMQKKILNEKGEVFADAKAEAEEFLKKREL